MKRDTGYNIYFLAITHKYSDSMIWILIITNEVLFSRNLPSRYTHICFKCKVLPRGKLIYQLPLPKTIMKIIFKALYIVYHSFLYYLCGCTHTRELGKKIWCMSGWSTGIACQWLTDQSDSQRTSQSVIQAVPLHVPVIASANRDDMSNWPFNYDQHAQRIFIN